MNEILSYALLCICIILFICLPVFCITNCCKKKNSNENKKLLEKSTSEI